MPRQHIYASTFPTSQVSLTCDVAITYHLAFHGVPCEHVSQGVPVPITCLFPSLCLCILTYMERMEAARMLRVLTEEEAAGRSRAMRAGAAQERALREAFMEAIEAEKERLLALRKERTTVPVTSMGSYLQELRRAEEHYLGLLGLMEDLAAAERRQRLAAEQDAISARRALASETAALHHQRVVDVLDRLAVEESAAIEKQRRWRERHRQELARQLRWAVRVKH
ncbi:hypothetical protein V8C86DRAFT_2526971 [Haematococcus lacustris]